MPEYQWAVRNGEIITADYDRSMALNGDQVKTEIKNAFESLGNTVNIESVSEELSEVYKVSITRNGKILEVYVCAKGTTPGGKK